MSWWASRTFGQRYRVRSRIGKGGQGEVYRASCDVVVKRLIRIDDPDHQQRMKREFEAARSIDHPNVIKVLDGDFGAAPYIVMEYLRGEPLATRMTRARRRNRALDCVPLILQAMQGVAELHRNALIHRDLKPENIFVRTDRAPEMAVVLDLGAVKFLQRPAHHGQTTTGVRIGTYAYMAPEQASGNPVHEPADIYALGVILYELLVGRRPSDVTSSDRHDAQPPNITRTLEAAVERIERVPQWSGCRDMGDLRASLVRTVMKALAHDPADRYDSVSTFAVELERAVGLAESTISPAGNKTSAQHGRSASPPSADLASRTGTVGGWSALAAGIIVLAAVVAAIWWPKPALVLQLEPDPPAKEWIAAPVLVHAEAARTEEPARSMSSQQARSTPPRVTTAMHRVVRPAVAATPLVAASLPGDGERGAKDQTDLEEEQIWNRIKAASTAQFNGKPAVEPRAR